MVQCDGSAPGAGSSPFVCVSGGAKLSRKVNTTEVKNIAASIIAVATMMPPAMLAPMQ